MKKKERISLFYKIRLAYAFVRAGRVIEERVELRDDPVPEQPDQNVGDRHVVGGVLVHVAHDVLQGRRSGKLVHYLRMATGAPAAY